MFATSVGRDHACCAVCTAYHSRMEGSSTLVISVTMWNQGNWAAGCCPICRSGQVCAKTFMYLRFRLENPRISGKASRRSADRRSMTYPPQPWRSWRSRISTPMW